MPELHEFRVRPVTRYIVTSYHEYEGGAKTTSGGRAHGEFENADTAYQVAYALCRQKHEQLGYAPGDMRVKYPDPLVPSLEISRQSPPAVFQENDENTAA